MGLWGNYSGEKHRREPASFILTESFPSISISQSISPLTFISDAEAGGGAAVVRGEQQEQDVGRGDQEMRCLGAVVLADQRRRGGGAIPNFQCVVVDLSLEPARTQTKTNK